MNASQFKPVILGAVLGAVLGASFAWVASDKGRQSEEPTIVRLGPSDYFQLGIGVLTLARQFGTMLQKSLE